eukprot:m.339425 g.339425  ORF g.339425 m.339425 type:complete len:937 (+) comp18796_c0_seq1:187-2997(+)
MALFGGIDSYSPEIMKPYNDFVKSMDKIVAKLNKLKALQDTHRTQLEQNYSFLRGFDPWLNQTVPDLPSIVVIGTQSAGKSSVLNAIAGFELLATKNETCTRVPTRVELYRMEEDSTTNFPNGYCVLYPESEGHNHGDKMDASNIQEVSKKFFALQDQLVAQDTSDTTGEREFSNTPIVLEYHSSRVEHSMTMVDLPGFCPGKDSADQVITIANSYMEKSNSILVVVSDARSEFDHDTTFRLCRDAACGRFCVVHNYINYVTDKNTEEKFKTKVAKIYREFEGREIHQFGVIAIEEDEKYAASWEERFGDIKYGKAPVQQYMVEKIVQGISNLVTNPSIFEATKNALKQFQHIKSQFPASLQSLSSESTLKEIIQTLFIRVRETVRINFMPTGDFEAKKHQYQTKIMDIIKEFVKENLKDFFASPLMEIYAKGCSTNEVDQGNLLIFNLLRSAYALSWSSGQRNISVTKQIHNQIQEYLEDALVGSIIVPALEKVNIGLHFYQLHEQGRYPRLSKAIVDHFHEFLCGKSYRMNAKVKSQWWMNASGFAPGVHKMVDDALTLSTTAFSPEDGRTDENQAKLATSLLRDLSVTLREWHESKIEAYSSLVPTQMHTDFIRCTELLQLQEEDIVSGSIESLRVTQDLYQWASEVVKMVVPKIVEMKALHACGGALSSVMRASKFETYRLEQDGRLLKWNTEADYKQGRTPIASINLAERAETIEMETRGLTVKVFASKSDCVELTFCSDIELVEWRTAIHQKVNSFKSKSTTRGGSKYVGENDLMSKSTELAAILANATELNEREQKKLREFNDAWAREGDEIRRIGIPRQKVLSKIYGFRQYYSSVSLFLMHQLLSVVKKCFYLIEQERLQEDYLRIMCVEEFLAKYNTKEAREELLGNPDKVFEEVYQLITDLCDLYKTLNGQYELLLQACIKFHNST